MKIVLNKCYGGFSLSHEAMMRIFEKRGIKVFPYISDWKGATTCYSKFSPDKLEHPMLLTSITYFQEDPKLDSFLETWAEESKYEPIYLNFDYDARTDKDLIEVVEALGKAASGRFAKLKIVEIPDGASYEIEDYDGIETAHYGFQIGTA